MAGLPKKYAKMGFKKGWAEYNKVRNRRKSTGTKRTVKRVAKRRSYKKKGTKRYTASTSVIKTGSYLPLMNRVYRGFYIDRAIDQMDVNQLSLGAQSRASKIGEEWKGWAMDGIVMPGIGKLVHGVIPAKLRRMSIRLPYIGKVSL